MHFDVRIMIDQDTNKVVCNNRINRIWGQEEREIPFFPFVPNAPFEMIISYEDTCFKVCELSIKSFPASIFKVMVMSMSF